MCTVTLDPENHASSPNHMYDTVLSAPQTSVIVPRLPSLAILNKSKTYNTPEPLTLGDPIPPYVATD